MFLQSIIVNLGLMFLMIFCGVLASKKSKNLVIENQNIKIKSSFWSFEIIIPIILFAIFMGMRYDVGVDQLSYLNSYLNLKYSGKGEFIFNIFSDIGWFFNLHYTNYFFAIALVQILFIYLAFKENRFIYPYLVFFLFVNGNVLFFNNVMRQALAICIWLYALKFIINRKPIYYFIICFLLFFVHRSSIILFLFYPILRNGFDYFKSVKLQLALYASAFIIRQLILGLIGSFGNIISFYTSLLGGEDNLYKSYDVDVLTTVADGGGSGIANYFKIILNIIIIIYSPKLKIFYGNKFFNILYFFFVIGLFTFYIFPDGLISLTRPFRYFYIFQSIMFAYFLYYLYRNRTNETNVLLYYGIIIVYLLIFLLSQYSSTEASHSLYQFYFQNPLIKEYPKLL